MNNTERKTLFIVRTISIKELSQEELQIEYEVCKIRYKTWKNASFQDYLDWYKDVHKNFFEISSEDFAYFESSEEARTSILSNQADMNDGGAYKYAAVVEVPYKASYPDSMYVESFELYRFNKELEKYEDISLDADEETKALNYSFNNNPKK